MSTLTGTRVVRQERSKVRATASAPANQGVATPPHPRPSLARLGPYDLNEPLGPTGSGELFLGFDPRLKCRVRVHAVHDAAPLISTTAHDARGAGRLHWLGGQRSAFGGWDAYEAPEGQPFVATTVPQPWSVVRGWLLDLAPELQLGLEREALGPLTLDHIWITRSRAKLLDFRAPDTRMVDVKPTPPSDGPPPQSATLASAQQLLYDLAARALGSPRLPRLPLSASRILGRLSEQRFAAMADVVAALKSTGAELDAVTLRGRAIVLVVTVLATLVGFALLRNLASLISVRIQSEAELVGLALALLWALVWRNGFWLRTFGLAVVTADGREVSRARATTRVLVAWSWVPIQVLAAAQGWAVFTVIFGWVKVVGVLWTAADPTRGPHDRVAGTYLVPR